MINAVAATQCPHMDSLQKPGECGKRLGSTRNNLKNHGEETEENFFNKNGANQLE